MTHPTKMLPAALLQLLNRKQMLMLFCLSLETYMDKQKEIVASPDACLLMWYVIKSYKTPQCLAYHASTLTHAMLR
jgi:hypothetical protein